MAENPLFSDAEYMAWVKELKNRIRQSQIKASVRVNSTMLELYWSIGADIVNRQAESKWGSKVIAQLSRDLRSEFTKAQGFSETNLKYMRRFYLTYSDLAAKLVARSPSDLIGHQIGDQLGKAAIAVPKSLDDESLPAILSSVPWRHHIEILTHSATAEEAVFYLVKTVEDGWSRSTLKDHLKSELYSRQGKAPNNYVQLLPALHGTFASEMLKDPYNFDFIALREKYVEMDLEKALVANVTKLLLELGHGFAFLGEQVPVMAGTKELWIDLLLYHVKLHCYVVVELKTEDFDAAFTGQLGAYVTAVNHHMKTDADNPTIGLLICRSKDNVYAAYSLESSSYPIGISAYEIAEMLPDELKNTLPSIEEIEETLKDE